MAPVPPSLATSLVVDHSYGFRKNNIFQINFRIDKSCFSNHLSIFIEPKTWENAEQFLL